LLGRTTQEVQQQGQKGGAELKHDQSPRKSAIAQLLAQEANEDDVLSAYVPSLEAAYRVASPVVNELATHWEKYREQTPATAP
jgi:purine nucleoside permease